MNLNSSKAAGEGEARSAEWKEERKEEMWIQKSS